MLKLVNVLDHVAITVSDIDRSLAFYVDLLGLKEIERHRLEREPISTMTGKENVVMQVVRLVAPETDGIEIDLQQYIEPVGKTSDAKFGDVRHSHICFGVPNLAEAYEKLSAEGVKFVSEPVRFDLGWAIVHVVFFEDPDGNGLELMQVPFEKKK